MVRLGALARYRICSIEKTGEQSENVYENKGRGQKVTGWRRRCR